MNDRSETIDELVARGERMQDDPSVESPYDAWRAAAFQDIKAVLPEALWAYLSGSASQNNDLVYAQIAVPGYAPIHFTWHTYHKALLGAEPFAVQKVQVDHPSMPGPFWNGGDSFANVETALAAARERGRQMLEETAAYEYKRKAWRLAMEEEEARAKRESVPPATPQLPWWKFWRR
jgi:hypothetical protein